MRPKVRKETWWQQEFAVLKFEATANSVTGHVCVYSNKKSNRNGCIWGKTLYTIIVTVQYLYSYKQKSMQI